MVMKNITKKSDTKHSTKQWGNALGLTFWNEVRVRSIHASQKGKTCSLIFSPNTMSFMRWFTIFRRKTKPSSAGLILSKSALEVIPFPMADHGAERRGKGTSHLTPAHSASSYWPHHSNTTASHMHHLSSHRIQAGSKQHWEPKASLWASRSLLLQNISAAFSSLLSQQDQFEVAQHLHSEIKKTSFCHQKAVEGFPASYLQAHAHWTLIGPHLLCGSSNASPAGTGQPPGFAFLKPHFVRMGEGCVVPLSVFITLSATFQR